MATIQACWKATLLKTTPHTLFGLLGQFITWKMWRKKEDYCLKKKFNKVHCVYEINLILRFYLLSDMVCVCHTPDKLWRNHFRLRHPMTTLTDAKKKGIKNGYSDQTHGKTWDFGFLEPTSCLEPSKQEVVTQSNSHIRSTVQNWNVIFFCCLYHKNDK